MQSIRIDVLTSPSCARCVAFLAYWESIRSEWPAVSVREVSTLSAEGQSLALQHRVFAAPGIIINDVLFASGGYDADRFQQTLQDLSLS